MTSTEHLDAIFGALADPTRRAILARLVQGEASVNEIAEPFAMTLPAITKHLKVLEKASLITRSREAQYRPCRIHAEPLKEIDEYLQQYRKIWEDNFDRLDTYLQELQSKGS